MASNMIPLPPRTPTPPPDEHAPQQPVGLGFEGELSAGGLGFDPNALSPMSATFPSKQYATLGPSDSVSQRATPTTLYTPASATFPYTPASALSGTDTDTPSMSGTDNARNPFNFQSVTYQPGRSQAAAAAKQNVKHLLLYTMHWLTTVGYWKEERTQVQAQ